MHKLTTENPTLCRRKRTMRTIVCRYDSPAISKYVLTPPPPRPHPPTSWKCACTVPHISICCARKQHVRTRPHMSTQARKRASAQARMRTLSCAREFARARARFARPSACVCSRPKLPPLYPSILPSVIYLHRSARARTTVPVCE